MSTCIVTGGAGFLGSHLCEYLLGSGHRVICIDNLDTGSLENIDHIRDEGFVFSNQDITEPVHIDEPVDFVYHLASPASPIDYARLPLHTLKVGSYGTHHMLGVAKFKRARILVASTSEVYGDPEIHPQPEDYWGNVNQTRLGRARRRRHLGGDARDARRSGAPASPRRATRSPRSASRTSARRSSCGTARPAGPCTARSCGRTAAPRARCDELRDAGARTRVRQLTGLVLDPYFSATKLEWLFAEGGVDATRTSRSAPSTRGCCGSSPAAPTAACTPPTRRTRAARCSSTSGARAWSDELLDLFGVPRSCLPEVMPSSGRFGVTAPDAAAGPRGAGLRYRGRPAGRAVRAGVLHAGHDEEHLRHRLVRAAERRRDGARAGRRAAHHHRVDDRRRPPPYAMEGAIFVTGAAIQWLRDGLGVIAEAAETGPLAASVPDTGGVYVVPAFTGLGSPWWDPYARGTIVGITRGTTRAHLARAVVEAMAFQTCDVVDAMTAASGTAPAELRGRRRRERDGPAVPVPGRPARRAGAARRGAGDHRARRGVPRRHRRRRVGVARRGRAPRGAPTPRSHRRSTPTNARARRGAMGASGRTVARLGGATDAVQRRRRWSGLRTSASVAMRGVLARHVFGLLRRVGVDVLVAATAGRSRTSPRR